MNMNKTYESLWHNPDTGVDIIVARGSSKEYVRAVAQRAQFVPFTIREYQTEDNIREMYREWRAENGNKKPNRVIVKMHWEDESPEDTRVDTLAIIRGGIDICNMPSDDAVILFYCSSLKELLQLLKENNGSDFVLDEVLEFYKK
jgi:hypothetical protein